MSVENEGFTEGHTISLISRDDQVKLKRKSFFVPLNFCIKIIILYQVSYILIQEGWILRIQ